MQITENKQEEPFLIAKIRTFEIINCPPPNISGRRHKGGFT